MVQLDEKGLVPAIAQNADTGEVIMLGYMSQGSLERTLADGDVWFYSRSRSELWHKGEISGNYMHVRSIKLDCDGDAILVQVEPAGPICHTGQPTCFFTTIDELPEFAGHEKGIGIIEELFAVIQDRKDDKTGNSYTAKLFDEGLDRICQKVIEEAGEAALAGVKGDADHLTQEVADLVYHTLVLLAAAGVRPEDVWKQLRERRK